MLKQLTLPGLPNGLIGTRAGLILVYVATNVCGHTFFLRNFFRSLPSSLAESVLLDGGGHKDIFFRVMLPLSAPAVGTMTILPSRASGRNTLRRRFWWARMRK